MTYLWIALMVVLLVTEAATMQFVSIWFAGGALVTAIATMCGANELWQISIFVVGSGILLVLTRPFAKRISESQKNNKAFITYAQEFAPRY